MLFLSFSLQLNIIIFFFSSTLLLLFLVLLFFFCLCCLVGVRILLEWWFIVLSNLPSPLAPAKISVRRAAGAFGNWQLGVRLEFSSVFGGISVD